MGSEMCIRDRLITARKNIYEAADSNLIAVSGDKSKISDFHNWFRGS